MSNELMKREMQEAVAAGEQALQSLYAAREQADDTIQYVQRILSDVRRQMKREV